MNDSMYDSMYVCMYAPCPFVVLPLSCACAQSTSQLTRSLVHHVIVVAVGSDGSGDDRFTPFTPSASTHTHIDDDIAFRIGRYHQERRVARVIWNARADCMNGALLVYLVVLSLASCSLARCVMLLISPVLSRSRIDGLYHSRSRE